MQWQGLGSVEMLVFTFPQLDFVSSNQVMGALVLLMLGLLVSHLEYFLFSEHVSHHCLSMARNIVHSNE